MVGEADVLWGTEVSSNYSSNYSNSYSNYSNDSKSRE